MDHFDVVVIGGGPAGENIAGRCGDCHLRIAVVEAELLGGECSYWACIPSKALLRPGEVLAEVRRVPGAAEAVTGALDVDAALARRDSLTGHWDDAGQVRWLEGAGGTLVRGHGRLVGERLVEVEAREGGDGPVTVTLDDGRTITGDEILVAVGRRPATTDLGLETVGLEPGEPIEVNDRLQAVGVPGDWLYAIGDANGRVLLTHMGK